MDGLCNEIRMQRHPPQRMPQQLMMIPLPHSGQPSREGWQQHKDKELVHRDACILAPCGHPDLCHTANQKGENVPVEGNPSTKLGWEQCSASAFPRVLSPAPTSEGILISTGAAESHTCRRAAGCYSDRGFASNSCKNEAKGPRKCRSCSSLARSRGKLELCTRCCTTS